MIRKTFFSYAKLSSIWNMVTNIFVMSSKKSQLKRPGGPGHEDGNVESAGESAPKVLKKESSLDEGLRLASGFLQTSIAESTLRQYQSAYKYWKKFCSENGLQEYPASVEHISSCVAIVASETRSVGIVENLASAIAYEHRKHYLPSPTLHESFRLLIRSVKRNFAGDRKTAEPISRRLMDDLIDYLFQEQHGTNGTRATLSTWRTVWRVLMEYHTLARFSDVALLKTSDLHFFVSPKLHLKVTFRGGKTDIFKEGSERVISSNPENPKYCPVRITQLYLDFLGLDYSGTLLPRCLGGAKREKQRPDPVRTLSHTTALEDFRDILTILGYDAAIYSEHSGRRGGATTAANLGMQTDDLQRLGGWRSRQTAAKYTELNIDKRLSLSDFLNKK
jgi:hypothetical protein